MHKVILYITISMFDYITWEVKEFYCKVRSKIGMESYTGDISTYSYVRYVTWKVIRKFKRRQK